MLVKTENQLNESYQIRVHIESPQYHSIQNLRKDLAKTKIVINKQIPILTNIRKHNSIRLQQFVFLLKNKRQQVDQLPIHIKIGRL